MPAGAVNTAGGTVVAAAAVVGHSSLPVGAVPATEEEEGREEQARDVLFSGDGASREGFPLAGAVAPSPVSGAATTAAGAAAPGGTVGEPAVGHGCDVALIVGEDSAAAGEGEKEKGEPPGRKTSCETSF